MTKTQQRTQAVLNQIVTKVCMKSDDQRLFRYYFRLKDKEEDEKLTIDEQECIRLHEERLVPALLNNIRLTAEIETLKQNLDKETVDNYLAEIPHMLIRSEQRLLEERAKINILCPACKARLVFCKRGHYETLDEHVGNPNGIVSKKDTFTCPNEICDVHKHQVKWLFDGEGPFTKYPSPEINYIDNNDAPFSTWHRQYNAEKERKYCVLKTRRLMIDLCIVNKADRNGKRKWWTYRYDFRWFFADKNGSYTHYLSGINMLFFSLRQYANKYIRVRQFENKLRWEDKRWWAKLSFVIAKVLWKKDYFKALSLIKN